MEILGGARVFDTDLVEERELKGFSKPDALQNSYTLTHSYGEIKALLEERLYSLPKWTYEGDGSAGGGNYISYRVGEKIIQIGNFYEVSEGESDPVGDWVIQTRSEIFKEFPKLKSHIKANCSL